MDAPRALTCWPEPRLPEQGTPMWHQVLCQGLPRCYLQPPCIYRALWAAHTPQHMKQYKQDGTAPPTTAAHRRCGDYQQLTKLCETLILIAEGPFADCLHALVCLAPCLPVLVHHPLCVGQLPGIRKNAILLISHVCFHPLTVLCRAPVPPRGAIVLNRETPQAGRSCTLREVLASS